MVKSAYARRLSPTVQLGSLGSLNIRLTISRACARLGTLSRILASATGILRSAVSSQPRSCFARMVYVPAFSNLQ